jgi:hypothetical protein
MNWEALAAIAEFVGAIAVVVTLIYLAVQIRQNHRLIESQTIHAQTQQEQHWLAMQSQPEIVAALKKAYVTGEDLGTEDRLYFEAFFLSKIASVKDDFLHFRRGLMTRTEWEQRKAEFAPFFIAEYAREHWREYRQYLSPDLNSELSELAEAPPEHNYIQQLRSKRGSK